MAWAAAVANTPTSNRVIGFSGEMMDTSNVTVLPKNQLGSRMSTGQVLLLSLLKLLPIKLSFNQDICWTCVLSRLRHLLLVFGLHKTFFRLRYTMSRSWLHYVTAFLARQCMMRVEGYCLGIRHTQSLAHIIVDLTTTARQPSLTGC